MSFALQISSTHDSWNAMPSPTMCTKLCRSSLQVNGLPVEASQVTVARATLFGTGAAGVGLLHVTTNSPDRAPGPMW